ncbi:lipopolysaccharide biosynthesis protein [Streptomyces formicae]|uniref:lipopolysaccharide biosynthesis protein n=1 Tax=Streptomyces formicae TaxID=1616117 RepID=UPI001F5A4E44|nr:lipopolysaccharide biosynthesis protein [Streptomyces formicae]
MAEASRLREPDEAEEVTTGGAPRGGEAGSAPGGGDSMFRNAYALMLSTGVSAALGLGFWLVAARYYTEEAVGQGSAAIAAMRLLASVTATTMIGAVVRYVPRAGRATGPLVWRAYAVSSAVVCLACAVFLVTLDLWGPSYAPLRGPVAGLVFTAACVAWALLTLQDGVLTGLRKAVWVPVGNAVFSVGKLLLLAAFATAMPVLGVFVSWAAAIGLSVLPLGWLVFRRLIPRQAAADHDREPPRSRDIGRFLAGDSVGALFSLAMINLLPVMVAVRFDAAHNGFFYIAYTVGGTMEFMAINMASSLTAHASHSPDNLAEGVRGALRRMAVLLVPVVLVLIAFAPQILAPFGPDYAAHGTTVLRLLAAAALPRVVVELYIGVLRVQGRTGVLAALQGVMCTLVLGSAAVLLGPAGISGAGLAMLLSMAVMAVVSAPGIGAALKGGEPRRRPVRRRRSAVEEYGTSWAREAAERSPRAAYLRGVHDTPTPAFGVPAHAPDASESPIATCLWLLLGLAAGLFWIPLSRAGKAATGRLSGIELLHALPPVTVTAGVLLIVVHCAAVSLHRLRPVLLTAGLLTTVAALHTAPLLLGVRPEAAHGAWLGTPADLLAEAVGRDAAQSALAVLPPVLQLLCLVLAAVSLSALRVPGRITAGVVWVLAVAGWAAQDAFATATLPVCTGFLAVAVASLAYRRSVPGPGPVSGRGRSAGSTRPGRPRGNPPGRGRS